MQKFKVGDKVKVVKNSYSGYWPATEAVFVVKDFYNQDVDIEGLDDKGKKLLQIYHPDDLELAEKQEHPNQKLANAVAEILREAADKFLIQPSGKVTHEQGSGLDYSTYSCCAAWYCAEDKGWSKQKRNRVLDRYMRSLGVNPQQFGQIPGEWSAKKRQQTRHAWLYIAAQFAEENPDLVPTYGKKKVKV